MFTFSENQSKRNQDGKAIKNLNQTIKEIEWEILQCYDDNKLPYLQRAKKEAIICLTTLRDVRIYDILTNKN